MAQVINDVDNIGNISKDKDTLKLNSDLGDFDSQRKCNSNDELQEDAFMNLKRIHEVNSVEKLDTQTPVIVKLSNILVNGHVPYDEFMSNNGSKDDSLLDKVDLPRSDVNPLNSSILNNDTSLNSVCEQSSNCSVGSRSLRDSDDTEVLNLTRHDVNNQFSGNTYQTESGLSITIFPHNPSSASDQNDDICEKDPLTSACDNTENDAVTSDNSKKGSDEKESPLVTVIPRRSSRNLNKQKNYTDDDVVEVAPTDPLADNSKSKSCNKTIVVSDTKGLVELASNAGTSKFINKKEPTLVIIDTKSILSGHGPVPVSHSSSYSHLIRSLNSTTTIPMPSAISNVSSSLTRIPCSTPAFTVTPVSFPQYRNIPPQMKPIIVGPSSKTMKPVHISNINSTTFTTAPVHVKQPQLVLPSLTDDMFVVEAPSFIVPYVYEKPPIKALKEQINELETAIKESEREVAEKSDEVRDSEKTVLETDSNKCDIGEKIEVEQDSKKMLKVKEDEIIAPETGSEKPNDSIDVKVETIDPKSVVESLENLNDEKKVAYAPRKPVSYFESPLGKFFINIGLNLVEEHVQTGLLRSQKRKLIKEGSDRSAEIMVTVTELTKTLECSKENNNPFRMELKKCGLCDFATESSLTLAHHLETPHIKNFTYRCNFCPFEVRSPHDILHHMEVEHNVRGRLEKAPSLHQCPNCPFEENQKSKLTRHSISCVKKYRPEKNQDPPLDWEPPAKIPRVTRNQPPPMNHTNNAMYHASMAGFRHTSQNSLLPKLIPNLNTLKPHIVTNVNKKSNTIGAASVNKLQNNNSVTNFNQRSISVQNISQGVLLQNASSNIQTQVMLPQGLQLSDKLPIYQNQNTKQNSVNMSATTKLLNHPNISITPLQRPNFSLQQSQSGEISENTIASLKTSAKPPTNPIEKDTLVICEICDGYIKNLDGLRNHMQSIHKVKIHPKMIYNRPPLNCQKCQSRFFTDQGLERHLLGTHGLVTSSMQEAANKSKDGGRCPICGRVYQWKLLNHVARDHQMALKPAHLSYKCTVCTATFGMYKQFESHVYSAHSLVAKRSVDVKKPVLPTTSTSQHVTLLKPLKINDEITITPQPMKSSKIINKPSNNNQMVGVNSKSRG